MVAVTKATLTGDGGEGLKINDKKVVGAQEANIPDAAARTAALTLTLTGAATASPTALVITYAGGGTASATPDDIANGSTYATDYAAIEDTVATIIVELNRERVDVGLIADQVDKNVIDLADVKVNYDKLITDVEAMRVAANLLLVKMENHGLVASS